MKRALVHLLAGAVVAAGGVYAVADETPAPAWTGLRAGVGVADATWHVGAGAGQYASDTLTVPDPTNPASVPGAVSHWPNDVANEWDPSFQHVKQASSYGVASRLSMRAIVLQDGHDHAPVALLKVDNYLAQDYLTRRIAAILAADGSKVTYDHILMSATHNHNSPYYSTPSAGVWAFQDVMDLRMFEYQARAAAAAIEQAEKSMVPARVGATTVQFPDFQGNIAGQDLDNDGAPAGYPMGVNDHGLVVMRFDKQTDSGWKPLATYVNYAEHGESLETTDLISEDWWAPFQRFVDRMTGVPVVFSQGSVGSAEGPYDRRYPEGQTPTTTDGGDTVYKIWAHMNFAQAERGTHLLAEKVYDAWNAIGNSDPSVQAPYDENPVVDMLTHWVAGPLSHPYPSVGNCRTRNSVNGDPGLPAAGLPDCARGDFGEQGPLYQNLKAAGLPLPDNYDATSFSTVEENLRIKLQAVRIGDTLLASCSCEAQSDLIKNLESRTDATTGNIYDGFDYSSATDVQEAWPRAADDPRGQVQPCTAKDDGSYNCPDPRDWIVGDSRITVSKAAFDHMYAEVHNDANGWNDPNYVSQANSEPTDISQIKGNFTKTELGVDHDGYDYSAPACHGYKVSVGLGHTGDYDGYTVSYREYMARDAYRKALTSYGPHTADYMVTNLVGMAANLLCGTPLIAQPTDPLAAADEQRQASEAAALGQLSSFYYDGWSAQIPDNAGPARALQQPPTTVQRFDAVQFRWVGGDNWTDNPTVTVERQNADGTWSTYADQSGEVQVVLDHPAAVAGSDPTGISGMLAEQASNRAGLQEWHWRASFEVFDSYPRADVPGGQVPDGNYRFVVNGAIHQAGAATPYTLTSTPFTVTPWTGITAHGLRRDGSQVSFVIDPITYPRTPQTTDGIAFYQDDPSYHLVCTSCTFRPWATTGTVVSAVVEVHCGNGKVKQVPASYDPATQRWVATVPTGIGVTVSVPAGGIRDSYGETNGQPVVPVT